MVAAEPPRKAPQAVAQLLQGAASLGVPLETECADRLQAYVEILLLWRTRLSLTAAATPRDIVAKHIIDSLSIVPFVKQGFEVVDIGSGAGFPGIPISISCPSAHVVLLESRRKRANFLREVVRRINLTNAEVIEERAEAVAQRRPCSFDLAVSRALGPVADFLRLAADLVKTGGLAVAMKGPKGHAETVLPGSFSAPDIVPYTLAGGIPRMLMVYRHR